MPQNEIERKVVILGSGPAGLTAAIYASRAQLEPLVIDGPQPGGQLTITTDVENYPGFKAGIMGPILMDEFREQALRFGTEIINVWIDRVDLSSRPFTLYGKESQDSEEITTVIKAHTLIIATGASAKWLGVPGEEPAPVGLGGNGVSACATCDGFFFRERPIVVVGGGDTAMEESMYLSGLCRSVTLIHRREEFRASMAMQDRVRKNPKIKILYNTEVDEILDVSKGEVTGIKVRNNKNHESGILDVTGYFVAIGHTPNSDLFKEFLELHDNGYIKTKPGTAQTNVPGVFASGDVQDFVYRQAVTPAGSGCMAALEAERWLAANSSH
jgi:thioredoxin reductase (NADPH)